MFNDRRARPKTIRRARPTSDDVKCVTSFVVSRDHRITLTRGVSFYHVENLKFGSCVVCNVSFYKYRARSAKARQPTTRSYEIF